jgi:hypothetical protein
MSGTANAGQVLGIVDVYWGGSYIPIEPGGTFTLGGLVNKRVIAGAQVFFAREMVPSEASFTAVLQAGQSLTGTFGTAAQELQLQCDTGQIFILPAAFREGGIEFTSGEGGKVKVKIAGGAYQESVGTAPATQT